MAEKDKYIVEIDGKDNLSPAAKKAGASLSKLGTIAKVGAAAGIVALGAAFVKSIKAAGDAETRIVRFQSAMQRFGSISNDAVAYLQKITAAQAKVLGFDDETSLNVLARYVDVLGNVKQAQEALNTTYDFARATGMDLEAAQNAISSAFSGSTRTLKQYGIEIEKGATKTQILEAISKKFAGDAVRNNDSWGGSIERLNAHFGDAVEMIGDTFMPKTKQLINEVVIPAIKAFDKYWASVFPKEAKNQMEVMEQHLDRQKQKFIEINTAPVFNIDAWAAASAEIKKVELDIEDLRIKYEDEMKKVNASTDDTTKKIESSFKKAMDNVGVGMLNIASIIGEAMGQTAMGATDAWRNAAKSILLSMLDAAQQMLMAWAIVDGIVNQARLPATLAGLALIGAARGAVQAGFNDSAPASTEVATAETGGTVSSYPTSSAPAQTVSSGGGGGGQTLNINIMNPSFLSKVDFERTVDNMLRIAQENGWDISRSGSISIAEAV